MDITMATARAAREEAIAREATARMQTAAANRQTAAANLETYALEAALAAKSRSPSPTSMSRQFSPRTRSLAQQELPMETRMAQVVQQMETARREDRAYMEAQRREDRREAEEREQRLNARHEAELAAVRNTHQPAYGRYTVGQALTTAVVPKFSGDGTANWDEWLRHFERMAGAYKIPQAGWSNELIIKMTGLAGSFCDTQFPTSEPCPEWGILTAAMQRQFGRRYVAATAWYAVHAATRQPHETGLTALQRLRELTLALAVLGVPNNPGPNEWMCYVLQNNLSEEERPRWMAQANAAEDVSEDSIRDKEAAATATPYASQRSVATEERDAWFLPQRKHLENFLREQGKAIGGRVVPARAAPIDGGLTQSWPNGGQTADQATAPQRAALANDSTQDNSDGQAARLCAAVAAWESRAAATTRAPPNYHGKHQRAKNQATFDKRKANRECFKCSLSELLPGQLHYECALHGRHATTATLKVVVGGSCETTHGHTG